MEKNRSEQKMKTRIRLLSSGSTLFSTYTGLLVFLKSHFDTKLSCHVVKFLFDLILYVPVNNFFSYVGTGLPGLKQY